MLLILAVTGLIAYARISVPGNLLDSFDTITKSLDLSRKGLDSSIKVSYKIFENDAKNRHSENFFKILTRAKRATVAVDELVDHIELIRKELRENILIDSNTRENLNLSASLMIRRRQATVLKKEIGDTRKTLLSLLGADAKNTIISLKAKDPKPLRGKLSQSWELSYFGEGIPLQAVIATLAKIEADAKDSEYKVIRKILTEGELSIPPQQNTAPKFQVLALYENGGHHVAYTKTARVWLDKLAADSSFRIDYIQNTDNIDSTFLSQYNLFIQLDYPPYGWKDKATSAFKDYITKGRGGWIGFHHATLLGEFDGFPMWQWFSEFMGGIVYNDYIPDFASAKVKIENQRHPVMKGVPSSFTIKQEEWYSYNKSPRPNVQVLASVDESTYSPNSAVKMGDHPVIWTNPKIKARNVYIFMGHSPLLFDDSAYKTIVRNAIFWAAER